MAQRTYEASIRIPNRPPEKVTIQAGSTDAAKKLLEAQYGKGNVFNIRPL